MSRPLDSVRALTGLNQLRGVQNANIIGVGIPKHVTNVTANMANASAGATSTVTISFKRDPTDKTFAGVTVYARGYQSNQSLTQVGYGADSPVTVILNNTGESVGLTVQATGNGGNAPIGTAPSCGIRLPKAKNGGFGTTTNTSLTPAQITTLSSGDNPVIADANNALFWGPGISPSVLAMVGDAINGTPITNTANLVYCFQFVLPVAMTVRQMVWYLNSGNVGEVFSFGLYNSSKNLILQATNTRATGVNIYVTSLTATTLQPGVYWFAQTCSGTTANGVASTSNSWGGSTFWPFSLRSNGYSGPVQMSGTSANAASAGVLPSSLGTISNAVANVGASPCLPLWAS